MQLTKSEEALKKLGGNIWNVFLKLVESFFENKLGKQCHQFP